MQVNYEELDYIENLLTVRLSGFIYSNMIEERELTYYCDRPSFLDWLLRRCKKVKFNLKVKDLLLNPKPENTERIYIVEDGKQ